MQDLFSSQKMARFSASFLLATALAVVAGCSDNSGSVVATTTTPTTTTIASVASLQISATPTTIKSDNTTTSTITVTAVDANNATIPGAKITLKADTGLLDKQTLTTDLTGQAKAIFTSGTANKANRTATITATAGAVTSLLPVQIVGSTLALTATSATVSASGAAPATLTITAKDAGGTLISGAAVALTQTGSGAVTLTPATGTTGANGALTVSVAGATAGAVTVSVDAVGTTATTVFTVQPVGATFGISLVTLNGGAGVVPVSPKNSSMHIGDTLAVQVTAPTTTANVTFATTMGTWANGLQSQTVPTVAGIATATLSSTVAGVASVQALDQVTPTLSDTLTVGVTAATPYKILLQASPSVLPRSVGSTLGYSNLVAMVYDATNQPVGNAPVAFSIVPNTGTSSGETVSPVVVYSASSTANGLALGAAPTTFTSGSLSSGATGVQVRASVLGATTVDSTGATVPLTTQALYLPNGSLAANATTSSFDAAITIGGTAGSVAFGQATFVVDAGQLSTFYQYPMSVLVADSNGSPAPLGTVVNLSVWPIAWSTGWGCSVDPNAQVWDPFGIDPITGLPGVWVAGDGGTFYNEDTNQNLILDAGEDGVRKYYPNGNTALVTGKSSTPQGTLLTGITSPTKDGQITPVNSYGGTVASTNPKDLPGTATTDANGLATFYLTYTKSQAYWVVSRIHAQTVVQGSSAVGQLDWRLEASMADVKPCVLPPSPFKF